MEKDILIQEVNDDVLATVSGGASTEKAISVSDFKTNGKCRICEQNKKLNSSKLCYDCACHMLRRSG